MATVPYSSAALTTDGGSNGILSVASTAPFVKGSRVYLGASGLPTVDLEIAAILSPTQLAVKLQSSPSARYNSSGYTTALGATLVQPEQDVFSEATLGTRARVGRAVITAGQSNVTILNSTCTDSSNIKAWVQQAQADATLTHIVRTYPQAGKFTIWGNTASTQSVVIAWEIVG
jgi:hypothetical protein